VSRPLVGVDLGGSLIRAAVATGPATHGTPVRHPTPAGGAVAVLDAYGCDVIFIETVGAGQAEVDIAGTADTVVLVTVPGLGDSVQTLKAGIMEIGDVFAVNKADRGEADKTAAEIEMMLGLAPDRGGWRPAVLRTVASEGRGVEEVLQALERHRAYLVDRGLLMARRQARRRREIIEIIEERFLARINGGRMDELAARVAAVGLGASTCFSLTFPSAAGAAAGAAGAGAARSSSCQPPARSGAFGFGAAGFCCATAASYARSIASSSGAAG